MGGKGGQRGEGGKRVSLPLSLSTFPSSLLPQSPSPPQCSLAYASVKPATATAAIFHCGAATPMLSSLYLELLQARDIVVGLQAALQMAGQFEFLPPSDGSGGSTPPLPLHQDIPGASSDTTVHRLAFDVAHMHFGIVYTHMHACKRTALVHTAEAACQGICMQGGTDRLRMPGAYQ